MFKKNKFNRAAILGFSAALALTACGGGGGGSSSASAKNEQATYQGVEGPLDAVQQPLSEQVLGQLASAAAGTPLEGAVQCVDQVVVQDTVDILDSILASVNPESINDPQQALSDAATHVQLAVNELLADLPNLLTSLAGEGDCTGPSGGPMGSNPLAGTPLAALGDALAPLLTAAGGSGFGNGENLDLTALKSLTEQLTSAFDEGLSNLPAEVSEAPVLGGLLTTLQATFSDLDSAIAAVDSGDGAATAAAVATTLDNLLGNLLIEVVPVALLEEQAGQQGLFSSQIEAGIAQVTTQLNNGLGTVLDPAFGALFGGALDPLFGGLNTLLTPLGEAISGGLASGGSGAGPTGTPLDALLSPLEGVTAALQAGGSGEGLTGTPLDLLLDPVASALGGGAACPLDATPLAAVCSIVGELQSALLADPNADPLALLTGLLNQLLGGLLGGLLG